MRKVQNHSILLPPNPPLFSSNLKSERGGEGERKGGSEGVSE